MASPVNRAAPARKESSFTVIGNLEGRSAFQLEAISANALGSFNSSAAAKSSGRFE